MQEASKLSYEEIRELEQLFDAVVMDMTANPELTIAELETMYPVAKLRMCIRYAPLFDAADACAHFFTNNNGILYTAYELNQFHIHNEIQTMFTEQMHGSKQAIELYEETFQWV